MRRASVLWFEALCLFVFGLGLYGVTLAPTILWGDEGHLQIQAVLGNLHASAGSHPIWVFIAHQFTRIPFGDIAGRVNFVSALFGAATLALVYLIMREVGIGRWPAVMATLALAISHTFWSYAVRAEVYTLTLTAMALLAWTGLRWYHSGRLGYLIMLGLVLGLGMAIHLLVFLYMPGLLWLVWQKRSELKGSYILSLVLAAAAGTAPLAVLLVRDARMLGMGWEEAVEWALFTFEGYSFKDALFDFSWRYFASDLFQWLAFLTLQFVGLAIVSGIVGAIKSREVLGRDGAVFFLLLYAGATAFAFSYRVGDRYVFYLPSYLPFAVWVACGLQWGMEHERISVWISRRRWLGIALLVLLVATPVMAYRVGPELVSRGITFRDSRHVPGSGGRYYFLWPPKRGYYDARLYAQEVLSTLPENAILLMEPILASPVQFLQKVEGIRPDVSVRYCCWNIEEILAQADGSPIALASLDLSVYPPVQRIGQRFEIDPRGPVYMLIPRQPSAPARDG